MKGASKKLKAEVTALRDENEGSSRLKKADRACPGGNHGLVSAWPPSALGGVIEKLQRGERLSEEAVDEIDRLLGRLRDHGWSGSITADEALEALVSDEDDDESVRTW